MVTGLLYTKIVECKMSCPSMFDEPVSRCLYERLSLVYLSIKTYHASVSHYCVIASVLHLRVI